jgi:chemotaxis protein histidine kinase CheA
MMRAAHSIKGAARIVGIDAAVKIAHVMEDCLVAAQKQEIQLGPTSIDALLRGVDLLSRVAQGASGKQIDAEQTEVVRAIAAIRESRGRPSAPPHITPSSAPAILRLNNLDAEGARQLREQLLAGRERGQGHYQLDFAKVSRLDPVALNVLVLFARAPGRDGALPQLEFLNLSSEVRTVLHLTCPDMGGVRPGSGG